MTSDACWKGHYQKRQCAAPNFTQGGLIWGLFFWFPFMVVGILFVVVILLITLNTLFCSTCILNSECGNDMQGARLGVYFGGTIQGQLHLHRH
ncbi:hypothetical protein M440DRAFT_97579 [Trichoderma longibrachiatum ATCC 18648]|uniref:Uncharacterized protein n=1 Tax=Trichoderma longibrachiatum ATCC 18648 TaxID=983965 RepID=A0A2T4BZ06_TRILO|nr:hypothetical protein M440DRAFT_97579 [Trichoderma longibrachiatum ATCC 18648]